MLFEFDLARRRFLGAGGVVLSGSAVALLAGRVVSRNFLNVSAADPLLLAEAALAMLLTTAGACWLPARRASRISPSEPLRAE
jgi:ABC-type lipoprotein release transport system permease subunit